MSVALAIPLHNGEEHLRGGVLAALRALNPPPAEIAFVDDGSADGGGALMHEAFPTAAATRHEEALGFAAAANAALALTSAPFVLLQNQDVALPPDWLGRAGEFLARHPRAAAVSGLLVRPDGRVDSAGHLLWSDWVCTERHGGHPPPAIPAPEEVFGLSATATVYRRAALEEAAVEGEVFDASFGSYLEDVDLNIRLRHLGWESWLLPGEPAIHDRGSSRARKRLAVRRQGARNWLSILVKNLSRSERLRAALPCAVGWLWGLLRDPLATALDPGDEERLFRWREEVRARRKVGAAELRRWQAGFRLNPWRRRA